MLLLTHYVFLLTFVVVLVTASPRKYNLIDKLEAQDIDVNGLGCKCIMSLPTKQNTDSTYCLCYNRQDGTLNDSSRCRPYTDGVFTFCTDVTNNTKLWQTCVQHYCPPNHQKKPPKNKVHF